MYLAVTPRRTKMHPLSAQAGANELVRQFWHRLLQIVMFSPKTKYQIRRKGNRPRPSCLGKIRRETIIGRGAERNAKLKLNVSFVSLPTVVNGHASAVITKEGEEEPVHLSRSSILLRSHFPLRIYHSHD